uniref:Uncharacterized protein n=1 Tax=Noctiluca scintillans TaxID=2966 RepID=A0A7S1EYF5_NOCSC|mmetsp:Transcript_18373/g.49408  ORF Transcript_18373/g.49408 Transcript_18373/m.49408 type:complete len:340 (+) Transcript_18373:81-1100(+)
MAQGPSTSDDVQETEVVTDKAPSEDPVLVLPEPSKEDWDAEMRLIKSIMEDETVSDGEKNQVLHDALLLRIQDTQHVEEARAKINTRSNESAKERDRCRNELAQTTSQKTKLEASCRELQQQKSNITQENKRIAEEEEARHEELKGKFDQAIKDVEEKMDAELEVRQHYVKENDELRTKLQKFTETYEAQEKQLAEQRESRSNEMDTARKRLQEHKTMTQESKTKTALLEKQNEGLRKSGAVLREELQKILGKFDEFHEAVNGSNQRHGECKTDIDGLQSQLQDLEKENADLKTNAALTEAQQEQQVAQKQRDALEKLCENLRNENGRIRERVKGQRGG